MGVDCYYGSNKQLRGRHDEYYHHRHQSGSGGGGGGGAVEEGGGGEDEKSSLVSRVLELYDKISALPSLHPSKEVDTLFSQLVLACIPPSPIDVSKLGPSDQLRRSRLIGLCGKAESLLESHFSSLLTASHPNPLPHLHHFPYFSNYIHLAALESALLSRHLTTPAPASLAFIGSGPLPLTSILLALHHLPSTAFHNYDLDPAANAMAGRLVAADPDLSARMAFHTADIMDVSGGLKEHEVVFLAALVGLDREEKGRIVEHLAKHMAPGAILMVRSAHGARAFLYPVIDPADLRGFEVLSVFHPTDEVINSVIVARKVIMNYSSSSPPPDHHHHHHHRDLHHQHQHHQGLVNGSSTTPTLVLPCKCSDEVQAFASARLCHGNARD